MKLFAKVFLCIVVATIVKRNRNKKWTQNCKWMHTLGHIIHTAFIVILLISVWFVWRSLSLFVFVCEKQISVEIYDCSFAVCCFSFLPFAFLPFASSYMTFTILSAVVVFFCTQRHKNRATECEIIVTYRRYDSYNVKHMACHICNNARWNGKWVCWFDLHVNGFLVR